MSQVQLFECLPTEKACHELRRYVSGDRGACSHPWGFHNAIAQLPEVLAMPMEWNGFGRDDVAHDDPRWPTHCQCGYAFQPNDQWQHNAHRLWARASDPAGQLYTFNYSQGDRGAHACGAVTAPPGALRNCVWYVGRVTDWCGPDGRSAEVVLPDGCLWLIDGPSKGGGKWTRTGTWPNITANPSILTPGYHGWLRDGSLWPC